MHTVLLLSSHTNHMGQQHSMTKGRMSCMEEQQMGKGTAWHQSLVCYSQNICYLTCGDMETLLT